MKLVIALLITIIGLIVVLIIKKKKGFNFKEFADEISKNAEGKEYSFGKIILAMFSRVFSYPTLMIIFFLTFLYSFLTFVDLDDRDVCGKIEKLQFERYETQKAVGVIIDSTNYYYVYFEDPRDKSILHEEINSDLYNDYKLDKKSKHCITVNAQHYGVYAWTWVLLICAMIVATIIRFSDEIQ